MSNVTLNSRVKFPKGRQKKFLEYTINTLGISRCEFAAMSNICDRSLRDWSREKHHMSLGAFKIACEKLGMSFPRDIEILPEYWSTKKASRLGGKRYVELYGSPGTLKGRRKGGIKTQAKFRGDPELAKRVGFVVRKDIKYPRKSAFLAEFIGIMLGDGGIRNNHQFTVSFNGKEDKDYANYIQHLIRRLFGISSTQYIREEKGRADIVVSATSLVEFLQKIGIKNGNKVLNQVGIPKWIFQCKEYQVACLRGLFDTDGSIYKHRYSVNGNKYVYVKMCFSNCSIPILVGIKKMLEDLSFCATLNKKQEAIYIHRSSEVKRYFLEVGTSNPRYYSRYSRFFSENIGRLKEGSHSPA